MKLPWMKLYPSDLDRDCRCLSLSSFGAWVRIFMDLHYHNGERSLSLESWARVVGATLPQTALALQEICSAQICDSNLVNDAVPTKNDAQIMIRCRRIAREYKQRQTHNLRQQKYMNRRNNDTRNDDEMTGKKSEAKKSEAKNILRDAQSSSFETFWKIYPRHVARQNACKAFQKINPDENLLAVMIQAIERSMLSQSWQDDKFIPYPATWLNQRRWEDESVNPEKQTVQAPVDLEYDYQWQYDESGKKIGMKKIKKGSE